MQTPPRDRLLKGREDRDMQTARDKGEEWNRRLCSRLDLLEIRQCKKNNPKTP
jgi:hypothetical protein